MRKMAPRESVISVEHSLSTPNRRSSPLPPSSSGTGATSSPPARVVKTARTNYSQEAYRHIKNKYNYSIKQHIQYHHSTTDDSDIGLRTSSSTKRSPGVGRLFTTCPVVTPMRDDDDDEDDDDDNDEDDEDDDDPAYFSAPDDHRHNRKKKQQHHTSFETYDQDDHKKSSSMGGVGSRSPICAARATTTTTTAAIKGSMKKTKAYAKKIANDFSDNDHFRGCVHGGFEIGEHMNDMVLIAADLYGQQCSTRYRNRGNDHMFFVHGRALGRKGGTQSLDDDDENNGDDSNETKRCGNKRNQSTTAATTTTAAGPRNQSSKRNTRFSLSVEDGRGKGEDDKDELLVEPPEIFYLGKEDFEMSSFHAGGGMDQDLVPFRSKRGVRFPQAAAVMNTNDTSGGLLAPTPQRDILRRPRGSYETKEEKPSPARPSAALGIETPTMPLPNNVADLRELRLEMFRRDRQTQARTSMDPNPISHVEQPKQKTKTVSNHQETVITSLRSELAETYLKLEQARQDILDSRRKATEQVKMSEQSVARMFQNRINCEERLRKEIASNAEFKNHIADLSNEISQLKSSLNEAQNKTLSQQPCTCNRNDSPVTKIDEQDTTESEGIGEETTLTSFEIPLLKAENVELRAELAETRAALLMFKNEKVGLEKSRDEFKEQVKRLLVQVSSLEGQVRKYRKKTESPKAKDIDSVQLNVEMSTLREQLELANREVAKHDNTAKLLNEQLSTAEAEAMLVKGEITRLSEQLDCTQREAEEKARSSQEETKKLMDELETMKSKLAETNEAILVRASEHWKERQRLEAQLIKTQHVAHCLQSHIEMKEESSILKQPGEVWDLLRKSLE